MNIDMSKQKVGTEGKEMRVVLTENEREFVKLFRESDEEGKLFMWDLLCCTGIFGEDFLKDMQTVQGDRDAMIAVVSKWKATARELETT